MDFLFICNSVLLGIGLAMDAFSVSIANAMSEPQMGKGRMSFMAGIYAFFQFAMPMIGWFCVHTIATYFAKFEPMIPWIALLLLCYIGGKMLIEGIKEYGKKPMEEETAALGGEHLSTSSKDVADKVGRIAFSVLLLQGVATSIDALSVGFTIAEYGVIMALAATLIIAVVTYVICMGGLLIGRKVGEALSGKASILGGIILIGIGIEIFIKGVFF